MPKNETAADSRQPINLKWKLRKALEENVAPRDGGNGLDFGADVGVDGKLHLNALSDIVGPSGDALFTDDTQENVSSILSTLLSNYFEGKFGGAYYIVGSGEGVGDKLLAGYESLIATGLCTNFVDCFAFCTVHSRAEVYPLSVSLADLPYNANLGGFFDRFLANTESDKIGIVLGNGGGACPYMFSGDTSSDHGVVSVSVAEGKSFKPTTAQGMFYSNACVESVSGIDFSANTQFAAAFAGATSLASINCTGIKFSLDVSPTALGHDALVTLINSLETVTTAQTLTMGDEKLALLSDEEKLGATNKGWTLA